MHLVQMQMQEMLQNQYKTKAEVAAATAKQAGDPDTANAIMKGFHAMYEEDLAKRNDATEKAIQDQRTRKSSANKSIAQNQAGQSQAEYAKKQADTQNQNQGTEADIYAQDLETRKSQSDVAGQKQDLSKADFESTLPLAQARIELQKDAADKGVNEIKKLLNDKEFVSSVGEIANKFAVYTGIGMPVAFIKIIQRLAAGVKSVHGDQKAAQAYARNALVEIQNQLNPNTGN